MDACAEKALTLDNCLRLDEAACLGCAACARACPTAGLIQGVDAYRVLVAASSAAIRVWPMSWERSHRPRPSRAGTTVAAFMVHRRHRERLGDVIERLGRAYFDRMVWS